jgi:hypothetical protein
MRLIHVARFALMACLYGCSSGEPAGHRAVGSGTGGQAGAGNFFGAGGNELSGSGGSSGSFIGGSDATAAGGGSGFDTCASVPREANPTQVDVYVMLDQSGSMTQEGDRWGPVSTALKTFVANPNSAGLGVGIQYFPLGPDKLAGRKCDVTAYATPEVGIGLLPERSGALVQSIDAHFFTTAQAEANDHYGTPTRPALEGATNYVKSWLAANPTHVGVVLLATDGQPMTSICSPNHMQDIVAVAAAAAAWTPPVRTYVVGIGDVQNLSSIATAGGTGQPPFLVDGTGGAATEQQFSAALDKIRSSVIPCDYPIPGDAGSINFNQVNVEYTPGGTTAPNPIGQAPNQAGCQGGDGWYYDDPAAPTKVIMCEKTCGTLTADRKAKVNVLFGCPTVSIQ